MQRTQKKNPIKYAEFLRKEQRDRNRKRNKHETVAERRKRIGQRVALYRARKKGEASDSQSAGKSGTQNQPKVYQNPQSLGKAVARAKRSLPYSPQKRKEVVKHLAASESLISERQSRPRKGITDETKDAVLKFYNGDDISRQAPGMRDAFIIRSPEGKQMIQKRHLVLTILETHRCFLDENPNLKIGKSAFADLRPAHVFKSSETPRNLCLCRYHENMTLLLQGLHKRLPAFPLSTTDFIEACVCDTAEFECMSGKWVLWKITQL